MIANETCAAAGVVDEVSYRAGEGGEVLVVSPALAKSRIEHWLSADIENRRQDALARLDASLEALGRAGLSARGHLGDGDPLQALDDALRLYQPDEVVISTHPHSRSNWLERQVVRKARERYDLPVTHIVVDLEHEGAETSSDATTRAGARGPERRLRLFHASDYDDAIAIRSSGFRDSSRGGRAGVLVTERPPADEASDRILFVVDVPEEAAAPFEDGSDDSEGRRFLLPAELLNSQGPPISVDAWSE